MPTPAFVPARLARLHEVLAGHVERGAAPGLVSVVSRRGETHVDTIGVVGLGDSRAMRADAVFRISSMTKPIVAAAALVLVEECVLRLDDPVERFLPELAHRRVVRRIDGPVEDTVPAHRPITLRDLLTFRMGSGMHLGPCPVAEAAAPLELFVGPPRPGVPPEPDEWMRRFASLPLMAQPGERWLYNTGSDVLGVLIARASGQGLPEFLRERIFSPLGMCDTGFAVPAAHADRLVGACSTDPGTGALSPYPGAEQWLTEPAFPSGAGGLVSTAADYLAFARMLRDGRGPVLSRSSVRVMTADHLTPAQKALGGFFPDDFVGRGWGFGVSVVTRQDSPAAPVGQYGWDGGLGTVWRTDPGDDLIALLLTNASWTSPRPPDVARDFLTAAHAAVAS